MSVRARPSNCSSGIKVDFYWYSCDARGEESHLEAAVEALLEAIRAPGTRRWNPWVLTMVRSEFRQRLTLAAAGELVPVDEVSGLRDAKWPLFEIRWQDIAVTEVDGTELCHREIQVRLIHAEPPELSVCALGLHAHEKCVTGDVRAQQDAEIDIALGRYLDGYGDRWGQVKR